MKILQSLREPFASLGLTHPFKSTFLLILVHLPLAIFSCCAFIVFEAKDFSQQAHPFCVANTCLTVMYALLNCMIMSPKVNKLVQDLESVIKDGQQNERSRIMYENVNARVEKSIEFLNFSCMKITVPLCLAPNLIRTAGRYFVTFTGETTIYLPYPTWLVLVQNY